MQLTVGEGNIMGYFFSYLYREWPHRQWVGLAFRRSSIRSSLDDASLVISSPQCNTWSSGSTPLCRVGGATSLTPLPIAGCGRLQLRVPHWATDPLGIFPLFLKRTADVLAPRLSVVFWRLLRLSSFPACWRQANVTTIPKGPSFSSVANYRPFSWHQFMTCTVKGVWAFGGGSSRTIYGTLWYASNHPVCLSERFGYLWFTFVWVTYTAEFIGERAGGQDCADRLQCCFW